MNGVSGDAYLRVWWCVLAGVVGVWGAGWGTGEMEWVAGGWFAGACGLVGIGILVKGSWRSVCLALGFGALMGGYTEMRTGVVWENRIDVMSGVADGGKGIVQMRGVVVEGIELRQGRMEIWEPVMWEGVRGRGLVRVQEVVVGKSEEGLVWKQARGLVGAVMKKQEAEKIEVGDVVEIMGMMRGNSAKRNVGDRDWKRIANMEGKAGVISIVGGGWIEVIGQQNGAVGTVLRWKSLVRGRAMEALGLGWEEGGDGSKKSEGEAVLGSLILGEKIAGGWEIERAFARVGVGHVLAISGFHVAMIVGGCIVLVRLSGIGVFRGTAWAEAVVVCGVFIAMWVLIPVRVPMMRAMVLMGAVMIGRGLGRRYDTMAVLGWVAIGLMVWRPLDVLSMGWQLSVGVTGLLVWMGRGGREERPPPSAARTPPPEARGRRKVRRSAGWWLGGWWLGGVWLGRVWSVFRINGGCWLLAMPLVMWHVGVVSVVGIVMAGVVVVMAGGLMVIGYVQVVVGLVWPGMGMETLFVVEGAAEMVAGFVGWVDGNQWSSIRGVNLGVAWTIGATGLIWMALVRAKKLTKKRLIAGSILLVAWGGFEYQQRGFVDGVRVEMIDVGNGSAYLVQSGWDSFLYDGGSLDYRVGRTVQRVAWKRGVRKISTAVISHDNIDHFNGLVDLARMGAGLEKIYIGQAMEDEPSGAWEAVRVELESFGVEFVVMSMGDGFELGGAYVECVWDGGDEKTRKMLSANDASLVVRVEIQTEDGERAVLFTGDIGAKAIEMMGDEKLAGVVVMELPHHGSFNAAAVDFVQRVDPKVVLQSTGERRVGDVRWENAWVGRGWYASGGKIGGGGGGGAWVEIGMDGGVESGR